MSKKESLQNSNQNREQTIIGITLRNASVGKNAVMPSVSKHDIEKSTALYNFDKESFLKKRREARKQLREKLELLRESANRGNLTIGSFRSVPISTPPCEISPPNFSFKAPSILRDLSKITCVAAGNCNCSAIFENPQLSDVHLQETIKQLSPVTANFLPQNAPAVNIEEISIPFAILSYSHAGIPEREIAPHTIPDANLSYGFSPISNREMCNVVIPSVRAVEMDVNRSELKAHKVTIAYKANLSFSYTASFSPKSVDGISPAIHESCSIDFNRPKSQVTQTPGKSITIPTLCYDLPALDQKPHYKIAAQILSCFGTLKSHRVESIGKIYTLPILPQCSITYVHSVSAYEPVKVDSINHVNFSSSLTDGSFNCAHTHMPARQSSIEKLKFGIKEIIREQRVDLISQRKNFLEDLQAYSFVDYKEIKLESVSIHVEVPKPAYLTINSHITPYIVCDTNRCDVRSISTDRLICQFKEATRVCFEDIKILPSTTLNMGLYSGVDGPIFDGHSFDYVPDYCASISLLNELIKDIKRS